MQLKELQIQLQSSMSEVAQLQKQRKHLETRMRELTNNNDRLERDNRDLQGKKETVPGDGGEAEEADEEAEYDSDENLQPSRGPRQYAEVVQEAYNTDLKHIEDLQCVGITARDLDVSCCTGQTGMQRTGQGCSAQDRDAVRKTGMQCAGLRASITVSI